MTTSLSRTSRANGKKDTGSPDAYKGKAMMRMALEILAYNKVKEVRIDEEEFHVTIDGDEKDAARFSDRFSSQFGDPED